MGMKNIKLTVAYDGTNYHGFQEQRGTGLATVQEVLEAALSKVANETVQVIGAGRTDAGVHARGQVVNFRSTNWPVPTEKIHLAVNSLLPDDIAVIKAEEVPLDFHARFSATAKTYRYSIYNHRVMSPLHRLYAYHEPRPLDIEAMRQAAQYLLGTHDFKSFQAQGTPVKDTVRTIYRAELVSEPPLIHLYLRGNGFLYNMVRIITGTLLDVGKGKKFPPEMKSIIEARNRTRAGTTVPPHGLCLMEVEY
ncbi:tRNA pseudouridine synthase A [Desulfotomaculum nigrificans CO-1-SRB]|uniref:tRNA pseudouridine synthase A n=1 Tax=Desulfotomaculum nigrificans (strain DSM 14880 / VKM B-2319 / CO-1-SRB) TaxID=868595 RepID=F6B5S6_DESCC|nr:tRNA pseudouridine(38-40) synthase TruA [Desulfotomaculum nigrificans]AEF93149.1 tRNA pseudouridine synthase A [Desulfotomaculum nigrificans CO-1-SRB]